MKNRKLADHLTLISKLESLSGSSHFKTVAFQNAAEAVRALREPVEDGDPGRVEGVGKSVAEVAREFIRTGSSARLEDLEKRVCPAAVMEMTRVRGIGSKTAYRLWREQGIGNLDELIAAAEDGRVEKHAAAILDLAAHRGAGRVPHDKAALIGEWLRESLAPHCEDLEVCGSVRRGTEDSKDIDLVAKVKRDRREKLVQELADLGELLDAGDSKAGARVERHGVRMQVDLWMAEPWHFGANVLYATGSKKHHVAMRTVAQSRGLTLNEKGLFKAGDPHDEEHQIAGETERSVFEALRMDWVEPAGR